MANLTLNDVVIGLPEGFVFPTDSQPDGQRVADDAESPLAKRTKRSNANKAVKKNEKRVERDYYGSPIRSWNQVGAEAKARVDAHAEAADARAQAEVAGARAQAEAADARAQAEAETAAAEKDAAQKAAVEKAAVAKAVAEKAAMEKLRQRKLRHAQTKHPARANEASLHGINPSCRLQRGNTDKIL
jgi:hypothetical protein